MVFKFSITVIFVFLCNLSCISQQKQDKGIAASNGLQLEPKIEKIEVTEQTRGTNRLITFTPNSKITSVNGNVTTSILQAASWENIVKHAEIIDLSKISSFQSPTQGRFGDRALSSSILITVDGKVYESSSFDVGNPPKELENLYNSLFSDRKVKQKFPKNNLR